MTAKEQGMESAWKRAELAGIHGGQIVTPLVEWQFFGKGRRVRYCWIDKSLPVGEQRGEWAEVSGDFWDVVKQLGEAGITLDDHRF